jgi:uncharacterized membrane protein (GlpM family)
MNIQSQISNTSCFHSTCMEILKIFPEYYITVYYSGTKFTSERGSDDHFLKTIVVELKIIIPSFLSLGNLFNLVNNYFIMNIQFVCRTVMWLAAFSDFVSSYIYCISVSYIDHIIKNNIYG